MTDTEKDFGAIFSAFAPEPASKRCQKGILSLASLQMPNTRHEEWKYTSLRNLSKEEWIVPVSASAEDFSEHLSIEGLENVYSIVLIDGFWDKKLSLLPENIEIRLLFEAEENNKIEQYLGEIAHENDYFDSLNAAYATEGIYLRLPKNTVLDKPLVFYHLTDSNIDKKAYLQRNVVVAEQGSKASIIHIYKSKGVEPAFINDVTEIFVESNAHIDCYSVQNEHNEAIRIHYDYVKQESNSHFAMTTISLSGKLIRNNLHILIEGEHCESYMNGLSFIKGKSHVDNHTLADHRKPHSHSNEFYKGLFDEQSTGVFNGKIYVRQDAQKTNAYQQNRNILLSEQASIYTKPQLEIWADDVKCSHGATTGKLDETALFYMRTRGIRETEARKILLKSFAGEILDRIKIEPLRLYIESLVG